MIPKVSIVAAAFAAATAVSWSAAAQERPSFFQERLTPPSRAIELTLGTGYAQGFGRLQRGAANVVGAGAINDVASAGIGFEAGIGYRIDPRWMIGTTFGYQEFSTGSKPDGALNAMDSGSAARGAVGALDVTYHLSPYQRLDPWVRVGTGYRFLWEVHNSPGRTYGYHGFDWARLAVGADMRVSEDVAIAPVVGADLNTFVWKVGAPQAPIADLGTSVFVYAGLQGRFDVGVSNAKYEAAVSETKITQAELSNTSNALVQSNDQLDAERDKAAHLDRMVGHYADAAAVAELRAQAYRDMANRLQKQIDAGDLKVIVRDNRMILQLSDDVLFGSGHTEITPNGEATLLAVANALKPLQGRHFQVAGHTDNVPIHGGRFASNWELSTGRAVRVVHFLVDNGVAPAALSAAGYADVDPVAGNDTAEGRKHNRRTEITVQPNLENESGE